MQVNQLMARYDSVMGASIYPSGTLCWEDAKSERDEAKDAYRALNTRQEEMARELTTLKAQKEGLETDLSRSRRQLDELRTEKRMSE